MRKIDTIVLHHSASKAGSHTWADIEAWHKARGFRTIGYHFGVVNDGNGWEVKAGRPVEEVGAHAKGFNNTSIGVCFEGNFDAHQMPPEQIAAGITLVARLVDRYGIAIERVKMHRELPYPTACPGKFFPFHQIRGAIEDRVWGKWPV